MPEYTIREERPDSPVAQSLIARLDNDLIQNYRANVIFGLKPADYDAGQMIFLVAWVGEIPAGCGALRFLGEGRAELKRMFVDPAFRGRGIGKGLLQELEARGIAAEMEILLLETRAEQTAACQMYTAAGWKPIPCYGEYALNPESICFEKRL